MEGRQMLEHMIDVADCRAIRDTLLRLVFFCNWSENVDAGAILGMIHDTLKPQQLTEKKY